MALVWNKQDLSTMEEKKIIEVNAACEAMIYAGIDVELSGGVQHFSLTNNDQTNIDSMFSAITLGATGYPYHADGNQCIMYSAADILTLYIAYKTFVTQQTTYCNMLRVWINRETDRSVINSIAYGDSLPTDLAEDMEELMISAAAQIQNIVNNMTGSTTE